MTDKLDVIVWGATGFTGQLVVEYLVERYGINGELKWGVAGRNESRVAEVCQRIAGDAGSGIPRVYADSTDEASMGALARSARVICTTVGPYARYGSSLVEACATEGTHYCDLTGEVQWMRRMIDTYQGRAEASGARIVHTCGFDSIPSDLGVLFMQQAMMTEHGTPAVQVKYRVADTRGGMSGGTVDSLINLMEEAQVDASLRELLADPYSLDPRNMPRGPDGPDQTGAVYDRDFRKWTAPFVMAGINTRVVRRSNALMGYPYGKDFRYDEAMLTSDGPLGYAAASMIAGGSLMVMAAAAFAPTRELLRRVAPSPGEGPDRSTIENGYFNIELLARHPADANKNMKGRVRGDRDPGYGATAKMLAESAICLAQDELEVGGGLWTPASAMGEKLIQRLVTSAGMTFELVS
ncbi:MAG: saccharopine dehydrogenase family protein [Pseudomonadota bacterium]